jgi:Family of unknown function (DUF5317)
LLFLFAIVLGLAAGLLTGGRIHNLGQVRFRWPWLVVVAVIVREAVLLTPLNAIDGAQYLYVLSLAGIAAWTVLHWNRLRGIWLVSAGSVLNVLVILANSGRMPVAAELAGPALTGRGTIGQYTVMGPQTNLNALGDWIRLYPLREAYSPGDVLIAIGLAIVVFLAVRNPRSHKELSPP